MQTVYDSGQIVLLLKHANRRDPRRAGRNTFGGILQCDAADGDYRYLYGGAYLAKVRDSLGRSEGGLGGRSENRSEINKIGAAFRGFARRAQRMARRADQEIAESPHPSPLRYSFHRERSFSQMNAVGFRGHRHIQTIIYHDFCAGPARGFDSEPNELK